MSARRRILDDISKLATSAAGLMQGATKEAENGFRHRLEALLDRMDLVPRDEFDVVKEMAAKAREENARLEDRIAALEAAIAGKKPVGKTATKKVSAKKSAAKKTAAKKPAAKKSTTKKTASKKSVAKKSAVKKPAVKKQTVKKSPRT